MTDTKGSDTSAGDEPRNNDNKQAAAEGAETPKTSAVEGEQSQGETGHEGKKEAQGAQQGAGRNKTEKPAQASQSSGAQQAKTTSGQQAEGKRAAGEPSSDRGAADKQRSNTNKPAIIIAVVALIIAIIAMAGMAWVWQHSQQRNSELAARIEHMQGSLKADIQDWAQPKLDAMAARIDNVAATNAQQTQTLSDLGSELKETRLQVAGMAERMHGGALRWRLQQIEHLLIVANRRAQLYREPAQAVAALKLASQMVSRINDPRLFDARKRIIDSIAALNALPSPDIEGIALTLSTFIKQVPDLPLASDLPQSYKPETVATNGTDTRDTGVLGIDWSSGWHRFIGSVGHALQTMVTVRQVNGTQLALLPPNQVYFLTQNLILQLRSGRLALLEGNANLYRKSLSSAVDWLRRYFDTRDPAVKAMIKRLGQMQNIKLDWQAPDISGGLLALRDYMQARSQNSSDASQAGRAKSDTSASKQGDK